MGSEEVVSDCGLGPNVRGKRATTAGRQARAGENVQRPARPGLVACRWRSAGPRGYASLALDRLLLDAVCGSRSDACEALLRYLLKAAKVERGMATEKIHIKSGFEYRCERFSAEGSWVTSWYFKPEGAPFETHFRVAGGKALKADLEKLLATPDKATAYYRADIARQGDVRRRKRISKWPKDATSNYTPGL